MTQQDLRASIIIGRSGVIPGTVLDAVNIIMFNMTYSLPSRDCGLVGDRSVRVSVQDAESSDGGRGGGGGQGLWAHSPLHPQYPAMCKLFSPVSRSLHLSHPFFHSHPLSFSSVLPQHFLSISLESTVCTPSRPIHINGSKSVRSVRESVTASGVPGVSEDCLCSAHLSLPRLPGALPS